MIQIAPSVLSADFARLGEEVRAVEAAGADFIHVDVMDGHFVPNLTIGPDVAAAIHRVCKTPLDVHLMVTEVDETAARFIEAGAALVTVHVEAARHLDRTLRRIRDLGARPGVALNPATPLSTLEEVLHLVDLVVVMSVNPGFGGQSFIPEATDKIARLKKMIDARALPVMIEVDGGVKPSNAAQLARAGARIFVAGSAIFGQAEYGPVIRSLREHAQLAIP